MIKSLRSLALAGAVVAALAAVPALGQIELRDSYRVYEPIEVKVSGTPDVTLWRLPVALGSVSQENGKRLYVWAPPGRHMLSVTCLTVDWEARKVSATEHSAMLVVEGMEPIPPDPTPGPGPNPPPGPNPLKVTQVTLVYEKSLHQLPRPVLAELDRLNRAGILATAVDQDIVDGTGQVPDQYRIAIEAAKAAGLPCLVVQSADAAVRIKINPKTAQDVTEAVK